MCDPSCPPCPFGYAQVAMYEPPVRLPPTRPEYVKPLAVPTPPCPPQEDSDEEEAHTCPDCDFASRYSNFYNNYNVDYKKVGRPFEKKGDDR